MVLMLSPLSLAAPLYKGFYAPPLSCPKGSFQKVDRYQVDSSILLDAEHKQGKSPTCGAHAATAVLTALYKYKLREEGKTLCPKQDNLNVLDLIRKMNGSLDDSIDLFSAFWKSKNEFKTLAENSQDVSIGDLVGSEREAQAYSAVVAFERQLPLPKFNIRVISQFDKKEDISEVIIKHFENPSYPLLPIALGTCTEKPCGEHGHGVIATGITKTTCSLPNHEVKELYSIHLQNSWGPGGEGPYDLDQMSMGIMEYGQIIQISPCEGSGCLDHIENESDPQSLAIINYAKANDFHSIERLGSLENINQTENNGLTALYWAAKDGKAQLVEALLKKGADANLVDTVYGITPLWIAAKDGHEEVVKMLLENEAKVDLARRYDDATPLYMAVKNRHLNVMKSLIEYKANANLATHPDGSTPLYEATYNDDVESVQTLLLSNADVNQATRGGYTPLMRAVKRRNVNIIKVLLEIEGIEVDKSIDGKTPLYEAVSNNDVEIVRLLLARGATLGGREIPSGTSFTILALIHVFQPIQKWVRDTFGMR